MNIVIDYISIAVILITSILFYIFLWIKHGKKVGKIYGYIAYGALVGFISFLLCLVIKTSINTNIIADLAITFLFLMYMKSSELMEKIKS